MDYSSVHRLLERNYNKYNSPEFIADDPIAIPHRYTKKQDIEIAGFFAATLAWGQRKTILRKCGELMDLMDNSPFDFVKGHSEDELKPLLVFKHRTFNSTDLLYFIHFLKRYYQNHNTLESAFLDGEFPGDTKKALIGFHQQFTSDEFFPKRTAKHISTPNLNSACKRLNMFLRWMVRKDQQGVDFGMWDMLKPSQLICPCDLHVERVARAINLITVSRTGWSMAEELTKNLRRFDPEDPVKYDFALFGMGVSREF